jgi:hypothetical protein
LRFLLKAAKRRVCFEFHNDMSPMFSIPEWSNQTGGVVSEPRPWPGAGFTRCPTETRIVQEILHPQASQSKVVIFLEGADGHLGLLELRVRPVI